VALSAVLENVQSTYRKLRSIVIDSLPIS
jgi:hypothetical protein